jgi:hypothetical protein
MSRVLAFSLSIKKINKNDCVIFEFIVTHITDTAL